MRDDRPKRLNWRSCLMLAGWLVPLVLWVALLTFLKFNTGVAGKAMLLTSAGLAMLTAFTRRHSPAKAWRRARAR